MRHQTAPLRRILRIAPPIAFGLLAATSSASVLRFDDLIQGQKIYNFDGDGDKKAELRFSTTDPAGFNTAGPGANMTFIKEPGLEGTSLLSTDLRIDFLSGANRSVSFGFAVNSSSPIGSASINLYSSAGKLITSQTSPGLYTSTASGKSSFPEGKVSVTFSETAAYATLDFTSQFGRYILDDFEVGTPSVYGVFVGLNDGKVRGDLDATKFQQQLAKSLPGYKEGIVLTAEQSKGGVSKKEIKEAIETISTKLKPGDTFIFFDSSHGDSFSFGKETTTSPGNEYIVNTTGFDQLTDNDLASYLGGMTDIQKFVFLDSCHSGGFWGNNSESDAGDLEKLSNIGLFAGSGEDTNAIADSNGEGYLTASLIDAFTLNSGFLDADADKNRELSFQEIKDYIEDEWILNWMQDPVSVFEKAQGDEIPFTRSLWQPVVRSTAGFTGSIFGGLQATPGPQSVPEPAMYLLFVSGILGLLGSRRFNPASKVAGQLHNLNAAG